ncbi:hypothetical protein H6P81_006739 [Aristolochia fimbriata]|uniref:Secreted protein n=1 Tax=Aristolochia fimbriata TaxID=158543 RepID=A0AAV7F0C0_ARIFI|nr:hypothetical protein H6P81_006739 [Aristolochia fimbriata]
MVIGSPSKKRRTIDRVFYLLILANVEGRGSNSETQGVIARPTVHFGDIRPYPLGARPARFRSRWVVFFVKHFVFT